LRPDGSDGSKKDPQQNVPKLECKNAFQHFASTSLEHPRHRQNAKRAPHCTKMRFVQKTNCHAARERDPEVPARSRIEGARGHAMSPKALQPHLPPNQHIFRVNGSPSPAKLSGSKDNPDRQGPDRQGTNKQSPDRPGPDRQGPERQVLFLHSNKNIQKALTTIQL